MKITKKLLVLAAGMLILSVHASYALSGADASAAFDNTIVVLGQVAKSLEPVETEMYKLFKSDKLTVRDDLLQGNGDVKPDVEAVLLDLITGLENAGFN